MSDSALHNAESLSPGGDIMFSDDENDLDISPSTSEHLTNTSQDSEKECWMCKFHGSPVADRAVKFIVDSCPHISPESICDQLMPLLLDQTRVSSDILTKDSLLNHMKNHMLHCRVKMAFTIRDLGRVQQNILQNCITIDVENNVERICTQNVKVYLAVTREIQSIYRNNEDRMLFQQNTMDR